LVGVFVTFAPASIIQAIIPAAVPTPNRQGSTGTKFFICSGSFVSGNLVASDSNGNCVDSGGSGGGGQPGATFFSSTTQAGPSNSASEVSLIGAVTGSKTIPANTFTNGAEIQLVAQGVYTTPATTDSLTLKVKCGSTMLGSSTIQLANHLVTNLAWRMNLIITAIGTGASGAFNTNGVVDFVTSGITPDSYGIVNTSNVSYDFTTSCAFDVTGTWAAATMGEALTGTNVGLWVPGAPVTSVMGQTGATNIPFTTTDISTPSAPASGKTIWYTKAGTLCAENPSAVETCTGGGGSGGGVTFFQSVSAASTSVAPSMTVVAGSLLVSVGTRNAALANPCTPTDTQLNTWTQAAWGTTTGGFPNQANIAWAIAGASGADVITSCASANGGVIAAEIRGTLGSTTDTAAGSTSGSSPPPLTMTATGDIMLTAVSGCNAASDFSVKAPEIIIAVFGTGNCGALSLIQIPANLSGTATSSLANVNAAEPAVSMAFKTH
jgi:hypothetical protein